MSKVMLHPHHNIAGSVEPTQRIRCRTNVANDNVRACVIGELSATLRLMAIVQTPEPLTGLYKRSPSQQPLPPRIERSRFLGEREHIARPSAERHPWPYYSFTLSNPTVSELFRTPSRIAFSTNTHLYFRNRRFRNTFIRATKQPRHI